MPDKTEDKTVEPKKADKAACAYCDHKNDADAARCAGCGINFKVGTD